MDNNRLSWMMGGESGVGIMAADMVFSKTCTRGGLHIFSTVDYPSLIRGGHNVSHVQVDKEKIYSHAQTVDILVALNRETIDLHLDALSQDAAIIYDGEKIELSYEDFKRQDITLCNVPIGNIIKTHSLPKIAANTVALGASFGLVKYDLSILEGVLRDTYEKKGESIVESNVKAAKAGFDYTLKNYAPTFTRSISPIHHPSGGTGDAGDTSTKGTTTGKRMVITGNDAISMAAIRAGLKFYAAYPMTPATSILHFLVLYEQRFGYIVKQTEDEIAAINMAIGASYTGVRSMTGTSGGGFALMSEALGLAAITETPLVIVWAQRPGPSTGLATWTEQSDLKFALSASQGDFKRIVVAPGDASECFYETIRAFNMAEKYQVPVIIMTDKYLAESHESVDIFDTSSIEIDMGGMEEIIAPADENDDVQNSYFKRFALTDSGISPRAFPGGKAGLVRVESSEHDEYGDYTESEEIRQTMMDKRFAKFDGVLAEIGADAIKITEAGMGESAENKNTGMNQNNITIISWGSTKGPIKEASKLLANDGIHVRHAHVLYINPFDTKKMESIIKSADTTILVENNKGAQLGGVIKEHTGLDVDHTLLKYTGREFYPEELYRKIKEIIVVSEAQS